MILRLGSCSGEEPPGISMRGVVKNHYVPVTTGDLEIILFSR